MYTVELNFSDPARAEEWHAWYETYLAQLVLVPGLSTAQRFRAVAHGACLCTDKVRGIGFCGGADRCCDVDPLRDCGTRERQQ